MKFRMSLIGLLGVSFIFCGCSSFNRDWKRAGTTTVGVEGRWAGSWLSSHNGHTDKLRCLMEKISDENYRARFDSTYQKLLHFKSTVVLHGTMTNDTYQFKGEAKLPWWAGGIYNYDGHCDSTNFFSKYDNKYDRGTFQMTRPVN